MSDVLCDGSCRHHFRSSWMRVGGGGCYPATRCALAKHDGRMLLVMCDGLMRA